MVAILLLNLFDISITEMEHQMYQKSTTSFHCPVNHSLSQIPKLELKEVKCNLIFKLTAKN